jgi:hypothetical protein
MREISGDFAVEVCVSAVSDEKPQMGGLLVWKDKDNYAIGTIDRTIYCGAYKEGTATVFRGFKLWTR